MNKYNLETIQLINLFESLTHTNVKSCFSYNEMLVFIVDENQGRKAVGVGGKNVKRLNTLMNKKIKIVEYSSEPVKFIKGFISPIVAEEVNVDEKMINIKVSSMRDRGVLIGRNSKNLNMLRELAKKYFDLDDVKIL
jgi:transcription termination/antitermination protein NusA